MNKSQFKRPKRFKPVTNEVRERAQIEYEKFQEFRTRQHDNYRQDRQFYVDSDERASALFDKGIITISSGAFGLTATLVSTVFKPPAQGSVPCVTWSLEFFALSMFLIVINYIVGHFAVERQIKLLDDHQIKIGNNPNLLGEKAPVTCLRYGVLVLNIASLVSFGAGAWFFIKFIIMNLGGSL